MLSLGYLSGLTLFDSFYTLNYSYTTAREMIQLKER